MKRLILLIITIFSTLLFAYGCEKDTTAELQPVTVSLQRAATREECPNSTGFAADVYYLSQLVSGQPVEDAIPISTAFRCDPVDETSNVVAIGYSSCVQCHGVARSVVNSRHVKDNIADATQGFMKDNAFCISCHTDNKTINEQTFTLAGATSGLTCQSCHKKDGSFANNWKHGPVDSVFSGSESCYNCHADITTHAEQGHFAPFSKDIKGLFGLMYGTGVNAGSAHGYAGRSTNGTGACALCHNGAVAQNVLLKDMSRTFTQTGNNFEVLGGAVLDNYTGWSTSPVYKANYDKALSFDDNKKGGINCTTCHETHAVDNQALRTQDVDWVKPAAGTGSDSATAKVTVFSAEFMLCTSCHTVALEAKLNAGKPSGATKYYGFDYSLSAKYAPTWVSAGGAVPDGAVPDGGKILMGGAGTHGTTIDITGVTSTYNIYDTHFSGDIWGSYTYKADNKSIIAPGATKLTVVGYGVNPGARNACTSCHDVHKGSVVGNDRTTVTSVSAKEITENWAKSKHNNFTDIAFLREYSGACNKCHEGRAAVYAFDGANRSELNKLAFNISSSQRGQSIACATCHDLADNTTMTKASNMNFRIKNDDMSRTIRKWYEKGDYKKVKTAVNPDWVDAGLTTKVVDAAGTAVPLNAMANAPLTYAAFGDKSMVCIGCHAGRNTGERIVESVHVNGTAVGGADKYPVGTPTTSRALTDYVHYMDAAGTMTKTGPYNFPNREYATTPISAHAGSAPKLDCVTCHDVKQHTFKVFEDSTGTAITAADMINSAGAKLIIAKQLDGCSCHQDGGLKNSVKAKKGFDNALVQIKAQLATKGKTFVDTAVAVPGIYYSTSWVITAAQATPIESWTDLNELGAAYNVTYFTLYDKGGWAHGMTYTKQILWDSMAMIGGTFTAGSEAALWLGTSRPGVR